MYVLYHISVITQEGVSALMLAAAFGKTEVVVELMRAGANVNMQNEVCVCQHSYMEKMCIAH